MPEAFPLAWPHGRLRTPAAKRASARFQKGGRPVSVAVGTKRLLDELGSYTRPRHIYRIPPATIVISSNVELRRDGLPYSNRREPMDPGVALYFTLDKRPICLPCDTWDTVGGNLAAIAAHVSALRGIERWGVGTTEDHYSGFMALPAPGETQGCAWWELLGVSAEASKADIDAGYRRASMSAHPDVGGTGAAFHALTEARRQGLAAAAGRGA